MPLDVADAPELVTGESSLYGRLVEVTWSYNRGEYKGYAVIETPSQQHVKVKASIDVAIPLLKFFNQSVSFFGNATWRPDTWELVGFECTHFTVMDSTSLVDTFKALAAIAGGAFDNLNPDQLVMELRGADSDSDDGRIFVDVHDPEAIS